MDADRRTRRRARAAAVLVALVASLLAAAGPAAAAPDPATIARALRTSPVYVDPAYADSVPAAKRRALVRAVQALPYPVRIALVPLVKGDRYDGDAQTLIDLVHDRLGASGVYAAFDTIITVRDYGSTDRETQLDDATEVGLFEGEYQEPPIDKLLRFATALKDPRLHARALAVAAKLRRQDRARVPPASTDGSRSGDDGHSTADGIIGAVVILGALAIITFAVVRVTRRRGARPSGEEPVLPERVFRYASTARDRELRADLEARLVTFAETMDRDATPTAPAAQAAEQRALDDYAAARKLLAEDAATLDLVAAYVLADDGEQAMAAADALAAGRTAPRPQPLCFYDPLHGRAASEVVLRPGLDVPACRACAAAVRGHRPPDALRDGDVPWFEADTLWARTGLGRFDDDLAGRVLRGEARRG